MHKPSFVSNPASFIGACVAPRFLRCSATLQERKNASFWINHLHVLAWTYFAKYLVSDCFCQGFRPTGRTSPAKFVPIPTTSAVA